MTSVVILVYFIICQTCFCEMFCLKSVHEDPKINAFWILLYNVMTSVLSGNASFNISFLFSTPLLATFWPFFRTTTRALSFHLTGFISSITTSDLWEFAEKSHFPETLCIYKTMLANHFQLNPSCHMHNLWRR